MANYREELLRRQEEERRQQAAAEAQSQTKKEKTRTGMLLAGIITTLLAILVVAPMRFKAIAGEEIDPVEQYLATNVNDDITDADSIAEAQVASQKSSGFMLFAESIQNRSFDGLTTTDKVFRMKFLLADAALVTDGTTFDDVYASPDALDAVIAQYENEMPLLDPGEDSLYYVAMVDTSQFNDYGHVIDSAFAMNNDNGEVISDVIYDANTGIAYIPKWYYDEGFPRPVPAEEGERVTTIGDTEDVTPLPEQVDPEGEQVVADPAAQLDGEQDGTSDDVVVSTFEEVAEDAEEAGFEEDAEADGEDAITDDSEDATEDEGDAVIIQGESTTDEVNAADDEDVIAEGQAQAEEMLDADLMALIDFEPRDLDPTAQYFDIDADANVDGNADEYVNSRAEEVADELLAEGIQVTAGSPIQGQLLISYAFADDYASDVVTIPVSVSSQRSDVRALDVTDVTVPMFDTTTTIPIVGEVDADRIDAMDILVYEGGSDEPTTLAGSNGYYDNLTGSVVLYASPVALSSVKVVITTDEVMDRVIDTILQPEEAEAGIAAKDMLYWPEGEFTNLDTTKFKNAVNSHSRYDYSAHQAYINWHGETDKAIYAAAPYMYSKRESSREYVGSSNQLANAIAYGSQSFDAVMNLEGGLAAQNNRGSIQSINYGGHGTLTGGYSFPGDQGDVTTSIGGMDFSGIKSLTHKGTVRYLMGAGTCAHINFGHVSGAGYTWGKVRMRPLYIDENPSNGADPYVVIGFIAYAQGDQSYTGVYKFRLRSTTPVTLEKKSSNEDVTNRYPATYGSFEGAIFAAYKDEATAKAATAQNTKSPVATFTIKKNGKSESQKMVPGTYWIKELKAPANYRLATAPKKVTVQANKQNLFTFYDDPVVTNWLKIKKMSSNTAVSNGNEFYTQNCQGAVFGVYETKAQADAAGPGKENSPITKLTVGANGETNEWDVMTWSSTAQKYNRSFFVKELVAPTGYKVNSATIEAKVTINQHAVVSVADEPITVGVKVQKRDVETTKAPTDGTTFEFALYNSNKQELTQYGRKTSKNAADVEWTGLPYGLYYVRETAASFPYMVNDGFIAADVRPSNTTKSLTVTVKCDDTQRRGQLTLAKTDRHDGNTLQGVSFVLKASQDVTSPDGTKRHESGKAIGLTKKGDGAYEYDGKGTETNLVTDKDGKIVVSGLYLSKDATTFRFEEVATIDGHILNHDPVSVTVPKDETKATIPASAAIDNDINSIDIYKRSLADDAPVEGVTMAVWNSKDDLVVEPAGEGYDTIAIRTPDSSEDLRPVIVKRTSSAAVSASGIPEGQRIVASTDASIAEAEKQNADAAESTVTHTLTSDEQVDAQAANAEIAERLAELFEEVSEDDVDRDEEKGSIITVTPKGDIEDLAEFKKQVNEAVAESEVFSGYAQKTEAAKPADPYVFSFDSDSTEDDVRQIAPGVYHISLVDEDGTEVAAASDDVGIIGDASLVRLTVSGGAIKATSEKAGNQGVNATVTWDEDQNAWVANDLVATGSEYRIEIDGHTVKVVKTSEKGGAAHFGRYAASESGLFSQGWVDQAALPKSDSDIITKVSVSGRDYAYGTVTDAEGHIHIDRLPFGDFTIVEVKVPLYENGHKAFLIDTNAHHFNVKQGEGLIRDTDALTDGYHEGNEGDYAQNVSFTFKDDVTKLNVSKREFTGGPEIPGATLTLTDYETNDVIDEWVSGDEPHYIEGLKPGTYWLIERMTPNDYDQAEAIQFTVLPTGEIQHVEMLDAPISIGAEIDKRQEIAKPLDEDHMENGDGKNNARVTDSPFGYYDYSLDFRSTSNTWTDEFTVEDPLDVVSDGMGRLIGITTPQAWQDYDGRMNVWYKTNLDDARMGDAKDADEAAEDAEKGEQADDAGDEAEAESEDAEGTAEGEEPDEGAAILVAESDDTTGDDAQGSAADDSTFYISDADAEALANVTVTVAGIQVEDFDARKAGSQVDVTYVDGLQDAMSDLANHPEFVPVFEGLPEGWTATLNDGLRSSSMAVDGRGTAVTTQTVYMRVADDKHEYTYGIDYRFTSYDAAAVYARFLASFNATRNDGHVNPWLDDADAMASDIDGDGRIIGYDGWSLWAYDLPTMVSTDLRISDLNLADGEYITGIRFEYGRVETGFTTRPDEWDRELLKDEHDDVDDIPGADDRSFDAADAAADATAATIERLVKVFTSDASKSAEADIKARNEADQARYEKLIDEITEYNNNVAAEAGLPERFMEARQRPAYEGSDDDATKIVAAREAGKVSIQAALTLDDTAEGRLVIRKALSSALSYVKGTVDEDTYNELLSRILEFDSCYLSNDPDRYAAAKASVADGLSFVIDQIADTGLAGRVHYMPAVIHMQATENYVPDTELHNTAKVDAYRNGGGEGLEGHDQDEVRQRAKERVMEIGTILTGNGEKNLEFNLNDVTEEEMEATEVHFVDTVSYSGLRPGVEYVMIGELHIKHGDTDAGVLVSDGKSVRTQVVFTPENESGTIEVPMTATVGSFAPDPVVAFEELRLSFSGIPSEQILAEHKDITDEGQTVQINVVEADTIVLEPIRRIFQNTPLAQTGDPAFIGGVITASALAIAGILVWRRRNRA